MKQNIFDWSNEWKSVCEMVITYNAPDIFFRLAIEMHAFNRTNEYCVFSMMQIYHTNNLLQTTCLRLAARYP